MPPGPDPDERNATERHSREYYSVGEITVTDHSWVPAYVVEVTRLVESYGGRYLARTTQFETMEGDRPHGKLFLIIEWPSRAAAETFYRSDEYRPHRERRLAGALTEAILVAGEDINRVARGHTGAHPHRLHARLFPHRHSRHVRRGPVLRLRGVSHTQEILGTPPMEGSAAPPSTMTDATFEPTFGVRANEG